MPISSLKGSNFVYWSGSEDEETADSPGGHFIVMLAGATLLVGDMVYLSAAHTVNKSTTATLYPAGVGVVIGGENTYMQVAQEDNYVGLSACDNTERVLVGILGKFKVIAGAAITLGNTLSGGTVVAGRAGVDATAGRMMAMAMETTAVVGAPILALFTGIH
jgi:hypothetical protein